MKHINVNETKELTFFKVSTSCGLLSSNDDLLCLLIRVRTDLTRINEIGHTGNFHKKYSYLYYYGNVICHGKYMQQTFIKRMSTQ